MNFMNPTSISDVRSSIIKSPLSACICSNHFEELNRQTIDLCRTGSWKKSQNINFASRQFIIESLGESISKGFGSTISLAVNHTFLMGVLWGYIIKLIWFRGYSHIINQDRDIESIEFLGDALVSFDRGVLTEVKHNHSGLSTVSSLDLLCNSGKFVCVPGDQHNVESTFCQFQSKSLTDSVS
eukprot:403373637